MRWLALMGIAACAGETATPKTIAFPHEAWRVDAVCGGNVAHDIEVVAPAPCDPWSAPGFRRFRVKNVGARARTVRVTRVVENDGSCDGPFVRGRLLKVEDQATCAAPEATQVAPGGYLELRIPPFELALERPCTKVGLAVHLEVDGNEQCAEMGAWVAVR